MVDSIGKDCKCIYDFEKRYVDIALQELIAKEEENIKEHEEQVRSGKLPEVLSGLKGLHARYVRDLKVVRERFTAMPTCEEQWTLVGTEPDRNKAEIWATHMRERGETIKIEGDKVYRQEERGRYGSQKG